MATERRTQLQSAPLSKQASGPDQLATLDESGSLLELANESQAEQTALLEASPVALQYSAALAAQVEAKHEQVERIEDKLEAIVQQQSATMRQMLSARPGVFSLPASRARWQQQVQRQGMIMQRLQGRLELVREIKEGMGPRMGPGLKSWPRARYARKNRNWSTIGMKRSKCSAATRL